MTAQPDFAHLVIDYVPDAWIVESKSLKLFFASFRNQGAFHEACTMTIACRLVDALAHDGCGLGLTGIHGVACRSTCSGNPGHHPRRYGFPTRASPRIAGAADCTKTRPNRNENQTRRVAK